MRQEASKRGEPIARFKFRRETGASARRRRGKARACNLRAQADQPRLYKYVDCQLFPLVAY
jgi:hypothetical protein